MTCPLCSVWDDEPMRARVGDWILTNCKTCPGNPPMFVYRYHTEPSKKELNSIVEKAKKMFPTKHVDLKRRSLPEHPHFHCR